MKKLAFIALLSFGVFYGQENNFKKYLANNAAAIDLASENQWEMLKADAVANQFVILGESHGAQQPQLIDYNLLKYLNETVGTRHYIAELDYAQTAAVNEFLEKGTTDKLNSVFRYLVKIHAQWGNQDFYNKIVKVRALNERLPKDKRIVFVGIDGVQDYEGYLSYIKAMIGKKKSPVLRSLRLVLAKKYDDINFEELTVFAGDYFNKIQQDRSEFSKVLKDEMPIFEYLIQNLSYGNPKLGVKRPEKLFRNYKQLYTILHLENQKLYGMWGYFHAHLVPVKYLGEDFASKLANSDHVSAKKIISVVSLPVDCKLNVWDDVAQKWTKQPFSYDNKSLLKVDGIEDLKELSNENSVTLFKLNSANSPFPKTGRLFNGVAPQGKLEGDFRKKDYAFQYVLLIRNSDWLSPLPDNF